MKVIYIMYRVNKDLRKMTHNEHLGSDSCISNSKRDILSLE